MTENKYWEEHNDEVEGQELLVPSNPDGGERTHFETPIHPI